MKRQLPDEEPNLPDPFRSAPGLAPPELEALVSASDPDYARELAKQARRALARLDDGLPIRVRAQRILERSITQLEEHIYSDDPAECIAAVNALWRLAGGNDAPAPTQGRTPVNIQFVIQGGVPLEQGPLIPPPHPDPSPGSVTPGTLSPDTSGPRSDGWSGPRSDDIVIERSVAGEIAVMERAAVAVRDAEVVVAPVGGTEGWRRARGVVGLRRGGGGSVRR